MNTSLNKIAAVFFLMCVLTACTYDTVQTTTCRSVPTLDVVTKTGTECGKATGSVEVIGAGGADSLRYSIDGIQFQKSGVFVNLAAQSYTITIKDANGCINAIETEIENLNGINVTVSGAPSGCNTTNGTLNVTASGGPEPYSFILNGGAPQSNPLFTNLAAGQYTLLAKDADGCSVQKTVSILTGQVFSTIKSIINTNCATSSCHGGSISPDFRNNQNIQNNASKIANLTASGSMPPLGSLSTDEVQTIACWVKDGAPLN
jgi:copper chaperone CopZ